MLGHTIKRCVVVARKSAKEDLALTLHESSEASNIHEGSGAAGIQHWRTEHSVQGGSKWTGMHKTITSCLGAQLCTVLVWTPCAVTPVARQLCTN